VGSATKTNPAALSREPETAANAGEYLWHRVIENDEENIQRWLVASVLPMLAALCVLGIVARYFKSSSGAGLVAAVVVFLFMLVVSVRWCHQLLARRADDYLGFFGERYVAEWLAACRTYNVSC